MDIKSLIEKAIEARERAYVPYSNFKVGAALLSKNGNVYTGCNIESASYTPTICAERTAISKAVSEGDREIEAIAVIGEIDNYTYPCGVCRQVIREFGKDATLIIAKNKDEYKTYKLKDLLPHSFGPEDLQKNEE
ncbi:cytidine deaminase [Proteiniborus ethanoligenes]|uniref:Cytidine deaminase n=1 Tax=Proteiniborus ethanoligenes TaxID=415015 RepID=A0A1H3R475_9FIRM|nr:cytidine deaminase [Proteiniborus ethanoligenes]TAH63323.1 MAG: cytidine deaminase [Gottschalkiaceae bacterium]SDZ20028.1 cytidine deaminase [Proteiniborus ethanoligenes]